MRNPRAFGSLAQHSGDFVLILLCGLMVMSPGQFQPANIVGGATTETKQIAVQPVPKQPASGRDKNRRQFHGQRPMTGVGHILAQLLFIWRENADATPSARNGHIPLLRVCRRLDGGIGKQDVIHSFALRTVGRDRIAGQKLPNALVQNAAIHQFNPAIGPDRFHRDKFTVGHPPADASLRLALSCSRSPEVRFISRVWQSVIRLSSLFGTVTNLPPTSIKTPAFTIPASLPLVPG